MSPVVIGEVLLHKAKSPLLDEAELRPVLADAKAAAAAAVAGDAGGVWRTVRLLASTARCTLQAGRADFALRLITTALGLCPEPFSQLASLQRECDGDNDENENGVMDGCALVHSLLLAVNSNDGERDLPAVVCTALMVWHGALVAAASPGSSRPRPFLRFSHIVGHILTELGVDGPTLAQLSACWLYNILAYSERSKNTKAVAFYLLEELCEDGQPEEFRTSSDYYQALLCSVGKNACVRMGLHRSNVTAMWNRLCVALYNEGCSLLHAAQNDVSRHAFHAMHILKGIFVGETIHYVSDFRRPFRMSHHEATLLRDAAKSTDLSLSREMFTLIRVAFFLKNFTTKNAGEERVSSAIFPLASVSSVVALAHRHRCTDIAIEILQAGSDVVDLGVLDSLLLWGNKLEALLDRAAKNTTSGDGSGAANDKGSRATTWQKQITPHLHSEDPQPLLHEITQSGRALDLLWALASCEALEELLPAGLAMIRGDKTPGSQLLSDKIAPTFVLDGLSRLILRLVDEGDVPLARCFLPLVVGICERMPSQANLLVTLHAIAAFAEANSWNETGDDDNDRHWTSVLTALRPLLVPRCTHTLPPYRQTKASIPGRTFSSRRRVFDSLRGAMLPATGHTLPHCYLQVLLTSDYKSVRLIRHSSGEERGSPWEKVLPIGKSLLDMVDRMQAIELQNRQHLHTAPNTEDFVLDEEEEKRRDEASNETDSIPRSAMVGKQDKEERADWWRQRYELDKALQKVTEKMQSDEMFGSWRVALCSDLLPSCHSELNRVAARLLQCINAPAHYVADVTMLLAALPFLGSHSSSSRHSLPFAPSHVNAEGTCSSCEEVLRNFSQTLGMELLKMGIVPPSTDVFSASRTGCLNTFTIMWDALSVGGQGLSEHKNLLCLQRASLYLVLDNELHVLPFEGMDVLQCGNVARVPTPMFISSSKGRSVVLGDSRVYCAIDPTGVMPKTLKRLLPVCQENGWTANRQIELSGRLLQELYSSQVQLYVYVGHGKGERLLNREELYERFPDPDQFPAVFLMGCSSAYMDGGSTYESYGMPYAFLHAGCPLFLGCLWHVTDGEIDRLTKRLLLLIAGKSVEGEDTSSSPPRTIGEALAVARRACKLPFLTGYATVIYGMNLPLESVGCNPESIS